jgi:hypothetical protein
MHYDWRRQHAYTNLCPHTGLTIPECSCPTCHKRQMARAGVATQGSRGNRRLSTNSRPKTSALDPALQLVERQNSEEAWSAVAVRIEHKRRDPVLETARAQRAASA